jgi:hypothetical protein
MTGKSYFKIIFIENCNRAAKKKIKIIANLCFIKEYNAI